MRSGRGDRLTRRTDAQKSRGQRTGWEVALRPFGEPTERRKTTCACALHPGFDGVDVTLDDQVKKRVCELLEALCCWAVDLGVREIGMLNAPEVLWLAQQAPDRIARKIPAPQHGFRLRTAQ